MATDIAGLAQPIAPRSPLELKLRRIWEQLLNVQPVGIHDDFFHLGGDSISAMSLLALIAQETGHRLPAGGLLQAPTIAKLAAILSEDLRPEDWSPMVPIQREGSRRPVFCIHPGGGNVLCYLKLAHYLGTDQPFYALQAPGVDGIREPLTSVVAMAKEYTAAIRKIQPTGPYSIAGWSAGGVIAFEIAQQLRQADQDVAHLGIIDSGVLYTVGVVKAMCPDDQPGAFELMREDTPHKVREFRKRSAAAKLIPDEADDHMAIQIMEMFQCNVRAVIGYRPQAYDGPVDLYQATESLVVRRRRPQTEWERLCSGLRLHAVPGNHLTMMHEPNVRGLAACMSNVLAEELESSLATTEAVQVRV